MQLVRGDFSKPLGNLTMHQSTLVMIEKGYVVSFTFIGGSEDEVDDLVERLKLWQERNTSSTPVKHDSCYRPRDWPSAMIRGRRKRSPSYFVGVS